MAQCELVFTGFCSLAAFPGSFLWLFSESEQQWTNPSLYLKTERSHAVCSPLSSPGLFNSVSVSAAKNPAASWVLHPTAALPALTFRAHTSLSFVFLTQPASHPRFPCTLPNFLFQCGSCALRRSGFQSAHLHSLAFGFSLV